MTNAYSTFRGKRGAVGRVIGVAATMLAALFLMTTGASAQSSVCLKRTDLAQALDGKYSEKQIAAGLDNGGKLLEVFASDDGATWTMIMTTAEGTSCVIAAGEKWLTSINSPSDPDV